MPGDMRTSDSWKQVVSRRNRLPVDRLSLDRTGGACGGASCGEYQG